MSKTNYAASHATLRITENRFSRSPYFECFANDRAVFGVHSGRFYPLTLAMVVRQGQSKTRRSALST
ncbi:MAG: hypothetical protein IIA73_08205 [Proteobacteria bacterium]|nr:hypothetical protein [Pseudomonadota bacterium]